MKIGLLIAFLLVFHFVLKPIIRRRAEQKANRRF